MCMCVCMAVKAKMRENADGISEQKCTYVFIKCKETTKRGNKATVPKSTSESNR